MYCVEFVGNDCGLVMFDIVGFIKIMVVKGCLVGVIMVGFGVGELIVMWVMVMVNNLKFLVILNMVLFYLI